MPAYDFVCQDCQKMFEVRIPFAEYSEKAKPKCPNCGSRKVVRSFGSVNVMTSRGGSREPFGSCGPGSAPGCCG